MITIDLEYRWKRYPLSRDRSTIDESGFPELPQLEDYAAVLPARRNDVLTPELIAEEYRVRTQWGDRPSRQLFFDRFTADRTAVESALDRIDAELAIERDTLSEADAARSQASQTTVTQPRASDETTDRRSTEAPGQLGRYRLMSQIGFGGFGEVWRAHDPMLDRSVAVKFPRLDKHFPPELIAEFRQEGRKLARMERIPGVVAVFDAGESDGIPYLVSELIDGKSLKDRLQEEPFSHQDAARLIADVAASLHQLHKKGLAHRDVKPSNVLLDRSGRPFLCDFGLAVTEEEQLTESAGVLGTYSYMSPEQARGEGFRADGRSDVYSLGVVLYRALTGRLPYFSRDPSDLIDQILHREPRPLRVIDDAIPEKLEAICLKCLRREPADRYTTALDLSRALRRWAKGRRKPRQPVLIVILASVAILFLVLVLNTWSPWRNGGGPPESKPKLPYGSGKTPLRPNVKIPIVLDKAELLFSRDRNAVIEKVAGGLRIQSKLDVAVRLFETRAVRYQFTVRFRIEQHQGPRPAEVGVFFGYHPVGKPAEKNYRFQVVQLVRRTDRPPALERVIGKGTIADPFEPILSGGGRIARIGVKDDDPGTHTLDVTVGHGLEHVAWDNVGVPRLSMRDVNQQTLDEDYFGQVGIINRYGTITILDCKLIILQHEW